MEKGEALTGSTEQWRNYATALVSFRSMQQPESRKLMSSAAAVLRRAGVSRRCEEEERDEEARGEKRKGPLAYL